jgi:hypothetical protein
MVEFALFLCSFVSLNKYLAANSAEGGTRESVQPLLLNDLLDMSQLPFSCNDLLLLACAYICQFITEIPLFLPLLSFFFSTNFEKILREDSITDL